MSTAATDLTGAGNPSALPPGTRLAEFEVRRVMGVGGFGIVYLAFDHALEREVAIKEYMPSSLVGRTATLHVSLRSQADAETFDIGLKSFVNEARLLASFDHPSLLKVLRFWEANGTAYMAMPVLRGQTLKQMRQAASAAPEEAWMRELLASMLDALERLHGANVYHRDISPDNIQIEPDGRAVLLDFGAARRVAADKSQTLTAILKPAYAPIEQYGEAGSVRQGPWTDFYALGATLHFLLLGRPPAPATARTLHDDAPSLVERAPAGYSADWLRLVDWMLAPKPSDRPQSVAALREVLQGRRMAPGRAAGPPSAVPSEDIDRTVLMARPQALAAAPAARAAPARRSTAAWLGGAAVALLAIVAAGSLWMQPAVAPPAAAMGPATPAEVVAQPQLQPPAAPASETAPAATAAPPDATAARPSAAAASTPPAAATMARPVELPVPASQSPRADTAAAPLAPARILSPATESRAAGLTAPAGGRQQTANAASTTPAVPAETTAPDSAGDPAAQGPEATCSTRPHLRYFACMERMCWRSENRQHPDCMKWRKDVPANN
jgi:hypothetical protein